MRATTRFLLFACGVCIACAWEPALAASADPLDAPDCRAALEALSVREHAASAPAPATTSRLRPEVSPALAAARRGAARACLASRADPDRPIPTGRRAEPPLAVGSVLPPVTTRPRPAFAPLAAPRIVAPAQPRTVTSCDPGGCWTSDGGRVDRVGPTLWGPRGACTTTGSATFCP